MKALAKKNETDFDSEYKLPKIAKNYKGGEVSSMLIEGFPSNASNGAVSTSGSSPDSPVRSAKEEKAEVASPESSPAPIRVIGNKANSIVLNKPSYFQVDSLLNVKWSKVLPAACNVIYTSLIIKRNVMGIAIKRQLILTDEPSLIYVDVSNMTVKGAVEWTASQPPKATSVSLLFNCFTIVLKTSHHCILSFRRIK